MQSGSEGAAVKKAKTGGEEKNDEDLLGDLEEGCLDLPSTPREEEEEDNVAGSDDDAEEDEAAIDDEDSGESEGGEEEDKEQDSEQCDSGEFDASSWRRKREETLTVSAINASTGVDEATGVVIWMHGLGDTPHGWFRVAQTIQKALRHTRWILPCAPQRSVSCNMGMVMTSWMDLLRIPVAPSNKDNGKDLPESVEIIHKLIDSQVEAGIPPNRIVLGGFSQGGALSLVASLKYPKALAGACILSGWCPPSSDVASLASASENKGTPFLVCHGSADRTVLPVCGEGVREVLQAVGAPVEFHMYLGMAHSSSPEEEGDITAFLKRVLP